MKKIFALLLSVCFIQLASAQLQKGQYAPEITLPNTNDSMVTLSSFKGKVILLDFWASWCGPCRRSNPKLVKLYNEFKGQGLEIIAISLDQGKMAWLQAIKEDGLPYVHLIDSRGSKSDVADNYGIYQIPTQFLIDKDGRLQEKDLDGKQLRSAIQQMLKK